MRKASVAVALGCAALIPALIPRFRRDATGRQWARRLPRHLPGAGRNRFSPTTGSCTKVAVAAETRLKAAGFAGADVQVIVPRIALMTAM